MSQKFFLLTASIGVLFSFVAHAAKVKPQHNVFADGEYFGPQQNLILKYVNYAEEWPPSDPDGLFSKQAPANLAGLSEQKIYEMKVSKKKKDVLRLYNTNDNKSVITIRLIKNSKSLEIDRTVTTVDTMSRSGMCQET